MNANIIYSIGVGCLIIGTALTYWGSHLKSEQSTKTLGTAISEKNIEIDNLKNQLKELQDGNKELIEGKNTLIKQNQEFNNKVERYQKDLEDKEKEIKKLEEKALKAERGISATYDFNGAKRTTTRPGHISLNVGPETEVFRKISELEKQRNYPEIINICEQQITKTPEWLTPYLFLGIAYANIGNKTKAKEFFEYVLKQAPGDPAYKQAEVFLGKLKE